MNQSVQDVFIIVKQWNVKHVYVQLYSTWTVVWVTAWIQLAALLKINNLSLVRNASKYREWHRFETKKLKQSKKKIHFDENVLINQNIWEFSCGIIFTRCMFQLVYYKKPFHNFRNPHTSQNWAKPAITVSAITDSILQSHQIQF